MPAALRGELYRLERRCCHWRSAASSEHDLAMARSLVQRRGGRLIASSHGRSLCWARCLGAAGCLRLLFKKGAPPSLEYLENVIPGFRTRIQLEGAWRRTSSLVIRKTRANTPYAHANKSSHHFYHNTVSYQGSLSARVGQWPAALATSFGPDEFRAADWLSSGSHASQVEPPAYRLWYTW